MCDGTGSVPMNGGNPIRSCGSQQPFRGLVRGCHVPCPGCGRCCECLRWLCGARSPQGCARPSRRLLLWRDLCCARTAQAQTHSRRPPNWRAGLAGQTLLIAPLLHCTPPELLLGRHLPPPPRACASRLASSYAVELRPTYAPNLRSNLRQRRLPFQLETERPYHQQMQRL